MLLSTDLQLKAAARLQHRNERPLEDRKILPVRTTTCSSSSLKRREAQFRHDVLRSQHATFLQGRVMALKGSSSGGIRLRSTTSCSYSSLPFSDLLPGPVNPFKAPPALEDGYQLEDCWVLQPRNKQPARGVVHFVGGAFIGASPVVGYATIIEALADAGFIVVTTPFNLTFDHRMCARRVAGSLTECLVALKINPDLSQTGVEEAPEDFQSLPLFAIGHSNGALLQLLMSSLEECQGQVIDHVQGAVLLSYNNKPVSEAIPGGLPTEAGGAMKELLDVGAELEKSLGFLAPQPPTDALTQSVLPLVDQLRPAFSEIASGATEFTPSPAESREIIRQGYKVPKTLMIRFQDDSIDETPEMAEILQTCPSQVSVKVEEMTGFGHITPLGADIAWNVEGLFDPLDAVNQAIKAEALQNPKKLAQTVINWLMTA